MILTALPVLEAESTLNSLFKPVTNEDSIYNMAMLVYEDEAVARKMVRVFADSKSK